ncbi:MAG: Ig-like domain-containing protein [Bellilinea sp.]
MNMRGSRWLYRLSNLGLIFVLVAGLALGSSRPVEAVSPIYVDDGWTGVAPGADPDGPGPATTFGTDSFATIQAGVDAVDAGGTVQVYAGTYTEQISINKNLTLSGEDKLTTIIEAPAVMSTACDTSVTLLNRPILCVDTSASATIQGFTLDGLSLGSTNARLVGIAFRNAGGVVQDNIIQNIGFSTLNGAEEGVGVYLYNSDLTARAINITGNTITNFNKNGITLTSHANWSPLTFLVEGNTITGYGPNQTIVQNGIQIELPRGSGTITGNTISNIAFNNSNNPQALVAVSILNLAAPDNPNTITTTGNTITGAQGGVYYFDGQGLISNNTIAVVNPSSTGLTGKIAFGIMATDPPWVVLSPYDSTYISGEAATNGFGIAVLPPPLSVEVAGNTISFSGADNTNTSGITSEAGLAESDLDINFHDNSVSGFEIGIGLYYCVTDTCPAGRYTGLKVISNSLSGNDNAIKLTGSYHDLDIYPFVYPEIHHNRIAGNMTGIYNDATDYSTGLIIPITAENNWWGCNGGPDAVGCDVSVPLGFDGSVDFNPWLVMTAAAIPGSINLGATAPFAVDLNHNSALAYLTPGDTVPATVPVSFSVTILGSVLPTAGFYTSGDAATTFTAPSTVGTYEVCGTTDNQSVCSNVTVEDFNDPPVITGQVVLTTPEDTPLPITLSNLTVTDPDDTSFVLTVLPGTNYQVSGTTITPGSNFVGDLTVNVTVYDGEADSTAFGLLVTVTAVNDAPVANNQSVGTPYQTDLAITLTMSDVDGGSPVTWTVIDAPLLHGSLSGTAPNLTYTPDTGYSGSDGFTFKVNDGAADSNVATVTITVASLITYTILLPVILK